jgi:MFS family permease
MLQASTPLSDERLDGTSQSSARLASMKEIVEVVSKGVIGFAAVCFVCGIVVVNLYLRDFGVASFSLFRVSYITAGVWTFSPIAFAAVFVGTILMTILSDKLTGEQALPKSRKNRWNTWVVGIIAAGAILGILFTGLQITFNWRWLAAIGVGFVIGFFWFALFHVRATKDPGAFVVGFVSVLGFLVYLLYLAPSLYKEIPASLGGGAGTQVVLVVPPDKQSLVAAAGVPIAEPPVSKPVTLLLESDKSYVVVADDSKAAITLNSDLVSAIRHLPPQK